MNRPTWIVELIAAKKGSKPEQRDVKYVRAATEAGAKRTAQAHSLLPLRASCYARIATPQDLGCTRSDAAI